MNKGNARGRIVIALIIAGAALLSYLNSAEHNPITGERQYVAMSKDQEIALGLEAAPTLAQQHGGLTQNEGKAALVEEVGQRIVANSAAKETEWQFKFHTLADTETINAFALPGGQVFITEGLLDKLNREDQLAGVLAHEIGHVIARHGAEHVAKQNLTQGLVVATGVAAGDQGSAQVAAMVGQLVNLKYGRGDELESDVLGVRFMKEAGYDPTAMIEVMEILAEASERGNTPEFFSSHPNPENRIENIKNAIENKD